ncbi:hypothetical protein ABT120_46560 [Nonomuraea angiospora]|uniref:hypothetical protein n=1 Tax=Nonomuraea angiospora TaxID=46172 RepID=UPI00331CA105
MPFALGIIQLGPATLLQRSAQLAEEVFDFEGLREEPARTGVDPDGHLGTVEQLYQLFLEVTESEAAESASAGSPAGRPTAAADVPPASPEEEAG